MRLLKRCRANASSDESKTEINAVSDGSKVHKGFQKNGLPDGGSSCSCSICKVKLDTTFCHVLRYVTAATQANFIQQTDFEMKLPDQCRPMHPRPGHKALKMNFNQRKKRNNPEEEHFVKRSKEATTLHSENESPEEHIVHKNHAQIEPNRTLPIALKYSNWKAMSITSIN